LSFQPISDGVHTLRTETKQRNVIL
jgi:hypothetical protein